MEKIEMLRKELDNLLISDTPYDVILKKSRELDHYITQEMIKINKGKIKVKK